MRLVSRRSGAIILLQFPSLGVSEDERSVVRRHWSNVAFRNLPEGVEIRYLRRGKRGETWSRVDQGRSEMKATGWVSGIREVEGSGRGNDG